MDITAADRLKLLYESLKEKKYTFYITEHIAGLNEQMRQLGLGCLIQEGCVRRTTHIALKDMGITRPYPLEGGVDNGQRSASRKRADNRVQEFVWAFGSQAEEEIERQIGCQIEQLKKTGDVEYLLHGRWSHMEDLDQMSGWNIWKSISKRLSIFPEKMKKPWQFDWKNTVRKCMTVLPENIRNLRSVSGRGAICWMNI